MKKVLLSLLFLAWASVVNAQTGVFPAYTVWGNGTGASALPKVTGTSGFTNYIDPVRDYDAACNGSTDDRVALQAALTAAITAAKALYIPGICVYSGTLSVTAGIEIFGAGQDVSALAANSATQEMISVTTTEPIYIHDLEISSTTPKTGGYGIKIEPVGANQNDRSVISNVRFLFQWNAIDFEKAAYWRIDRSTFEQSANGATHIVIKNTVVGSDAGDNVISNSTFVDGSGTVTFLDWQSSGGLTITGSKFLGGSVALNARVASNLGILVVSNNSLESQSATAISVVPAAGASTGEIVISDNQIDGAPTNAIMYFDGSAVGSSILRTTITGNTIRVDSNKTGIAVVEGTNFNVSANTFQGTGVAIQFGVDVVDSVIGLNELGGMTISNASTTTLVVSTASGATPQLNIGTAGAVLGRIGFAGSTSGTTALIAPAVASGTLTLPAATSTVAVLANNLGQFAATSSADLLGVINDETGTGFLVFSGSPQITTPTFVTNATVPLIIGGSGTTGTQLTLQTTSGVGTTDAFAFKGGNNGATTFATLAAAGLQVTSAGAASFAVGRQGGSTEPAFSVDSSTGSQTAGLKVTGAALNGTVAVVVTDTSGNTNLTINALGSGTIGIGSVSTGAVTITPPLTLGTALTVANGGSGATTLTGMLKGNGTGAFTAVTGTDNYVMKWSSNAPASTSLIYDNGTRIGINTGATVIAAGIAQFHAATDQNLLIAGAIGVANAIAFNAVNDANSANVPFELRASIVQISTGTFKVDDATDASAGAGAIVTAGGVSAAKSGYFGTTVNAIGGYYANSVVGVTCGAGLGAGSRTTLGIVTTC